MKYTCSMETVQQNGRFTLFSSKFLSIHSILYAYTMFILVYSLKSTPFKDSLIILTKKNYSTPPQPTKKNPLNKPEAEFKEFERRLKFKPLLKYCWFHLKFKPTLN